MTADSAKILGDPMFQLIVVLWMVQPAPPGSPIRPILREAGYLLSALSRNLPPPLELRPRLMALVGSDTAPAPDVLAEPPAETPWLVIECKGTSFGPDSSTARQALKVLAVARDLRSSLALAGDMPQPGFVAYLTRLEDRDRLADTLRQLTRRLVDAGLPASTSGVLECRSDRGASETARATGSGSAPTIVSRVAG